MRSLTLFVITLLVSVSLVGCATDEVPVASSLELVTFDVAEAGWGEAPLPIHFVWQITPSAASLTCQLDWDGDGTFDYEKTGCKADTILDALADLPTFTFTRTGEHHPRLVVSDGERTVEATTTVYANFLEFAPGVVHVDKLPGFTRSEQTWPDPSTFGVEPPHVVLHFEDASKVPVIAADTIVWGGSWFMKVVTANQVGATLALEGKGVALTDAVKNGFVGVRDFVPSMADAHCPFESCDGVTLEPIPVSDEGATPESPGRKSGALKIETGAPLTYQVKAELPNGGAEGFEHALSINMVLSSFVMEISVFELKQLDFEIAWSVKYEFSATETFPEKVFKSKPILLAATLLPVPLQEILIVEFRIEGQVKADGEIEAKVPFKIHYDPATGQWTRSGTPSFTADLISAALSLAGEIKLSLVPKFLTLIAGIGGPYLAPVFAVVGGAKVNTGETPTAPTASCPSEWVRDVIGPDGVKACIEVKCSVGGEASVEVPWIESLSFDKLEITLAETGREWCWGKCVAAPPGSLTDTGSVPDTANPGEVVSSPDSVVTTDTPPIEVITIPPDGVALPPDGLTPDCFEGMIVAVGGSDTFVPSAMRVVNVTKVVGGIDSYESVLTKPEVGDASAGVPTDATVFTFGDAASKTGVPFFPPVVVGREANRGGRSNLIAVWFNETTGQFEWMFNITGGHFSHMNELAVHRQFQFFFDSRAPTSYLLRTYGSSDGVVWKILDVGIPIVAVVTLPKNCFTVGQLTLSPNAAAFGAVPAGLQSAPFAHTVTNVGNGPTGSMAASITGPDADMFKLAPGTCTTGMVLPSGGNCLLPVVFSPPLGASTGPKSAVLGVSATPGGQPTSTLSGVVTDPGLRFTPNPLDLGFVLPAGSTPGTPVTLTNSGTASATLTSVTLVGFDAADFLITGGSCAPGVTLGVGSSCDVVVAFAPATVFGGQRMTTLLATADIGMPAEATLVGTLVVPAGLTIFAPTHAYGSITVGTTSPTASFSVANGPGSVPTGPLAVALSGPDASDFAIAGGTCVPSTTILGGGAGCTVLVTFTPSSPGPKSASLTVTAVPGGAVPVGLSGEGL